MKTLNYSILSLALAASSNAAILMDYDDGNAGNGIHDANIQSGDVGSRLDWKPPVCDK